MIQDTRSRAPDGTEPSSTGSAGRNDSGRAGHRPKLLFLCQKLPYPPTGGARIRTYNVLRLLARTFDVTALCFYRAGISPTRRRCAQRSAG